MIIFGKQVLLPDVYEAFMHRSVIDRWYLLGTKTRDGGKSWEWLIGPVPVTQSLSARPMAVIAMVVECERFIYCIAGNFCNLGGWFVHH